MLGLHPSDTVLAVVAHPDDETLGCGATLRRLASLGHEVRVLVLADGESSRDHADLSAAIAARRACGRAAAAVLGVSELRFLDYPDNGLDAVPLLELVKQVEAELHRTRPALVFTHHQADLNIDHQITGRATLTAARPVLGCSLRALLTFQIPGPWTPLARSFCPTCFVDSAATEAAKLDALDCYLSEAQRPPHPRSRELVSLEARRYGAQVGLHSAEAFEVSRIVVA